MLRAVEFHKRGVQAGRGGSGIELRLLKGRARRQEWCFGLWTRGFHLLAQASSMLSCAQCCKIEKAGQWEEEESYNHVGIIEVRLARNPRKRQVGQR